MCNQFEDWTDGFKHAEVTQCQEGSGPSYTLKLRPLNNTEDPQMGDFSSLDLQQ